MPKRDKLGLQAVVEKTCVQMLGLSIRASLKTGIEKRETIRELRISTETLKYLIRAESELKIIKENQYLSLQEKLQEISKEATGWERYVNKTQHANLSAG